MTQTRLRHLIEQSKPHWNVGGLAKEADLKRIARKFGTRIPQDYFDFLRLTNGGQGELPVNPWWFVIWAAETVIERWNDYEMGDYIPGYMAFGSNGGDEMFVFNLTSPTPQRVYMMPFIGMEPGAELMVARNFRAFVRLFGKKENTPKKRKS